MKFRIFSFLLLFGCVSCSYFSSEKNKNAQFLDTLINFKTVDASPTFLACDTLVDAEKEICFSNTIQKILTENLSKHQIAVLDSIDETIEVQLLITKEGKAILKTASYSKIPKLDSFLKVSLEELPKIYPAIKRGVPVNTQYTLPIKISLKEEN